MIMLLIVAISALTATAEPSPLATSPCEFGETYQLAAVHCTVEFANTSDTPVKVVAAGGLRQTDSLRPSVATIAPHSTAYFEATSNTEHDLGRAEHWFFVTTEGEGQPRRYTKASGFVISVLDDTAPEIDFGVVQQGSRDVLRKSMSVASREVGDLRLTSVLAAPSYLDAHIDHDGKSLSVTLKPSAPWGLADEFVTLETNAAKQPSVSIRIKADVHGEIVPSDNPLDLGITRKGQDNDSLIRLTSRLGKDFKVGKVQLDGFAGVTTLLPCTPASSGCKILRLKLSDEQPAGVINGHVVVDLPEFKRQLPIGVRGILIRQDAKIRDFNKESEEANAINGGKSVMQTVTPDLSQALHRAAKPADVEPPGRGPLLKWDVAHEELIYGYIIYRSESEAGPYLRVNPDVVRSKGDDPESTYQWRDNNTEAGKAYWYYIGFLKNNGTRQDLSTPQKIVAK